MAESLSNPTESGDKCHAVTLEALLESEERLRALNEAIPLPMMLISGDGVIVGANSAAHEALAIEPNTLTERAVSAFGMVGDEGMKRLIAELETGGAPRRIELRLVRGDGRPVWMIASAQPYSIRGQTRTLLTLQDISDLKRKELQLTEANEEAERTIRARMRFLAAASHDLRQPLQALALFASVLDHHVSSDQGRSIVRSMKASLRGMEEMFDSLMDMSKLDAGVMKAEPQVFMLNDVFERLDSVYTPQAEAAGLRLRIVPSSAVVRSDPRIVTRILGNFLSNAIRYTRTGAILLGARHRGNFLHLTVYDTGPGIPDSQRLEIFREFRRGDPSTTCGRGGGMGLGLAIVQRLAALLNHRLDLCSIMGRGTRFAVEVPLAEEWTDITSHGGTPPQADERNAPVIAGATVVVVDDDVDIQTGLMMILTDWGCRPVVADTAEAAVAVLASNHLRPDVILADLHLREKGAGVEAIRLIRAASHTDAPAFLFTGDTEPSTSPTPFPVLRKPLDPVRLRTVLAEALGR
jgi:two-component system, sensor histidine kinase